LQFNKSPIEDPLIIIGDRGYVQDNGGNIVAFDANTGHILWKIHQGIGRNFYGLTYDHGVLFSRTGYRLSMHSNLDIDLCVHRVRIPLISDTINWISKGKKSVVRVSSH